MDVLGHDGWVHESYVGKFYMENYLGMLHHSSRTRQKRRETVCNWSKKIL